jgi:multidrug efflux pump
VLGVLRGFTHPLTILSGCRRWLRRAAHAAHLQDRAQFVAFVGIIMLVGIVKNGIMMVDFAVAAQRDPGKSPLEAIHEACLVRSARS